MKLDLEFAICVLDDYYRTDPLAKGLRFFANGEPTPGLELMGRIAQYALEKYGRDITIEVQTNGAIQHCAGGCLGEALNETGSFFGINPELCEAVRYLYHRMPEREELYPFLHP